MTICDAALPFRGNTAWWLITCVNGVLDDIRLYNRPLTAQEIRDLYNSSASQ